MAMSKHTTHNLTPVQTIAVSTFLEDWPEHMSFKQLIEFLEETPQNTVRSGVCVNPLYGSLDYYELSEVIQDLHETLVIEFGQEEEKGKVGLL